MQSAHLCRALCHAEVWTYRNNQSFHVSAQRSTVTTDVNILIDVYFERQAEFLHSIRLQPLQGNKSKLQYMGGGDQALQDKKHFTLNKSRYREYVESYFTLAKVFFSSYNKRGKKI